MSLKGQYRHLTLRHEQRILCDEAPKLRPGEAQIHSFHLPSLTAGLHDLAISQTVTPDKDDPKHGKEPPTRAIPVKRQFDVLAPEWSLSSSDGGSSNDQTSTVMSVFPAPGQTAQFRTLPHMVLRDPHLPWARRVSKQILPDKEKNTIPWFALIAFTAEELELIDDERSTFFPPEVGATPNENLGWDLRAGAIEKIPSNDKLLNKIQKPAERDKQIKTSVVTVPGPLFKKLFTDSEDPNPTQCDVAKFRFLSHVRTVATEGTMSAIEGDWTYTALPPGSFDVRSALQDIGTGGKGLKVLRTDNTSTPKADKSGPETGKENLGLSLEELVTKRQNDGYTIVRHRTITGEQTVAMYRGPLSPTRVAHPLNTNISFQSNFGTDLQILDPNLGLMDISYATAWQLGRTLATSDQSFPASLARLRTAIHRDALARAKEDIYKRLGSANSQTIDTVAYHSRARVVSDMDSTVACLNDINTALLASAMPTVCTNRWKRREPVKNLNLVSLHSNHIFKQMYSQALYVSTGLSTSADGGPYCYHTVPTNTDYAAVQEWVPDKLHLAGIPSHHFIPDPSYLPQETIRVFRVDANWTDAMVALSLANHVTDDPAEDFCRSALKARLNEYLATPLKGIGYCQQMPTYGFLMKSQLLVQFPDIAVSAEFEEQFHTRGDWDKAKSTAQFWYSESWLRIPCWCCLIVSRLGWAQNRMQGEIDVEHQKIFASENPETDPLKRGGWLGGGSKTCPMGELFDWQSRTMRVVEYAKKIHEVLSKEMFRDPKEDGKNGPLDQYIEPRPTAAVFALQLNEPIYTLVIEPAPSNSNTGARAKTRKDNLSISADWEHLSLPLLKPEQRTSSFRFHPPPFPAHKYTPSALPSPPPKPLYQPTNLLRYLRLVSPIEYDSFIPTNRTVPFDLIFSILVPPASQSTFTYCLTKLTVRLTLGSLDDTGLPSPDDDQSFRPLVVRKPRNSEPPAPTMLSNLRFNVLRSYDGDVMIPEVVSRTAWGVDMYTLKEASFVLPMVEVIPWEVPFGKDKDGAERYWRTWMQMKSEFLMGDSPLTWEHGREVLLKREVKTVP
ncbi:uncharacterized protein Triagg1_7764 [Trichoderma aggressivum f. europaeum]|uniref:Uncharacterized protein n=1 Tax=Trichoderma aggressivum f. europaeum TaxID=173218 RepID=A0AAE1LYG3_9HYPO|nr:hypothetical protein Triagg1_7764 [Trichoderma aggressivum f. europaeum]